VVNGHKSVAASSHPIHIDLPDGGTDIATLVRRALAELCTVPVLLADFWNARSFLMGALQIHRQDRRRR